MKVNFMVLPMKSATGTCRDPIYETHTCCLLISNISYWF